MVKKIKNTKAYLQSSIARLYQLDTQVKQLSKARSEVKKDIKTIKKIENNKNINIPRKFLAFKKLFKSDNFNRFKCIFLPFDAVLKALK